MAPPACRASRVAWGLSVRIEMSLRTDPGALCRQLTLTPAPDRRHRRLSNSATAPALPVPADAHPGRGNRGSARRPATACGLRLRAAFDGHVAGLQVCFPCGECIGSDGQCVMRAPAAIMRRNRAARQRHCRSCTALQEQQQHLPGRDCVCGHACVAIHRVHSQHAGVERTGARQIRHIHAGFQDALQRRRRGSRRPAHAASAWRGSWPGSTCTYSTGSPCASSTAAICR